MILIKGRWLYNGLIYKLGCYPMLKCSSGISKSYTIILCFLVVKYSREFHISLLCLEM